MQETKFPGSQAKENKCQQWWWGVGGLVIGLILGVVLSMTVLKTSGRPSMPGREGGPQMGRNGANSANGGSGMQKKGQAADSDEQTPPSGTPTNQASETTTETTTSSDEVTE